MNITSPSKGNFFNKHKDYQCQDFKDRRTHTFLLIPQFSQQHLDSNQQSLTQDQSLIYPYVMNAIVIITKTIQRTTQSLQSRHLENQMNFEAVELIQGTGVTAAAGDVMRLVLQQVNIKQPSFPH